MILDTPEQIAWFRMATIRSGVRLELLGMKRHGRSCYAIAKETYGLKGSKKSVFDQLTVLVAEAKAKIMKGNQS